MGWIKARLMEPSTNATVASLMGVLAVSTSGLAQAVFALLTIAFAVLGIGFPERAK